MHLILSHFDTLEGPMFFFTSHPHLARHIREVVLDLLDLNAEGGFFEYKYYSEEYDVALANYIFELSSPFSRGRVERMMLSIVVDPIQKTGIFRNVLEKYVKKFKAHENLYKAFQHIKNNEKLEIIEQRQRVEKIFYQLLEEANKTLQSTHLGDIMVVGPSKVGKTSLLNLINQKAFNSEIRPTLGVQITRVILENYKVTAFDVGGQTKIQKVYKKVLKPPKGIIFVLDISFSENEVLEAKNLFNEVMRHYFGENCEKCVDKNIPVLILGNKIDLDQNFNKGIIKKWLELDNLNIPYFLETTSALENIRVFQSFRWIIQKLLKIEKF